MAKVLVVGGGLAGCEAAMYLAAHHIPVVLAEVKSLQKNPTQTLPGLAELVCSNSLKSNNPSSAHGILKQEMRHLGSLIIKMADACAVPAAEALAVDRQQFSALITQEITQHPLIELRAQEVVDPVAEMAAGDYSHVIICAGPLASEGLSKWLQAQTQEDFYFYDAIAPIVDATTLDQNLLYFKDRYQDTTDYLNVPLNKEQYYAFVEDLRQAEKVPPRNFEQERFYEGCLPIDLMAMRGVDTLRYANLKPVGLEYQGQRPFAVIQLRRENLLGEAFNLVGFQTRLKYGEQKRIFQKLPGFQQAEFLRYGSVHRNSYLAAARWLGQDLSFYHLPAVRLAGQIMGVEGYTESAAMGLYAAIQLVRQVQNKPLLTWPKTTAIGALVNYVQAGQRLAPGMTPPSPTNINFGLFPLLEDLPSRKRPKKEKQALIAARALKDTQEFIKQFDLGAPTLS